MVIFGLFGHEDQTFFIFWYKSKQDASIELKILKKNFFLEKSLCHLLSDILLKYYRILLNTFSMTNLDTLGSYIFGSLVVGTQNKYRKFVKIFCMLWQLLYDLSLALIFVINCWQLRQLLQAVGSYRSTSWQHKLFLKYLIP